MSYKSKRTIANIFVGVAVGIAYIIYALSAKAPQMDNLKGWAITILVLSGIGIVAEIVVQILFNIGFSIGIAIKEEVKAGGLNAAGNKADDEKIKRIIDSNMIEDEMEKMISLKSARIGYTGMGVGFLVAVLALALGKSAITALHIQLAFIMIGMLVEGITSIYLYERGV